MQEMRNNVYEPEVRISDKVPSSIKGDSTINDEDQIHSEPGRKALPFTQQKSTPVNDNARIDENTAPEDFKSELFDVGGSENEAIGGHGKGPQSKKNPAKQNNECRCFVITSFSQ